MRTTLSIYENFEGGILFDSHRSFSDLLFTHGGIYEYRRRVDPCRNGGFVPGQVDFRQPRLLGQDDLISFWATEQGSQE